MSAIFDVPQRIFKAIPESPHPLILPCDLARPTPLNKALRTLDARLAYILEAALSVAADPE